MNNINKIIIFLGLSSFLFSCAQSSKPSGYSSSPVRTISVKNFNPLTINEIIIMPFEFGEGVTLPTDLLNRFTSSLEKSFEVGTSLQIANSSRSKKLQEFIKTNSTTGKVRSLQVGRSLGVQGVLHGVISTYSDPHGNGHDARVGFVLWMLDVKSGQTVWEASFDHFNQPLTENLFRLSDRLKEGLAYQPAELLFEHGLRESAKKYEQYRGNIK